MNQVLNYILSFTSHVQCDSTQTSCFCETNLQVESKLYQTITTLDRFFILSFIRRSGMCLESTVKVSIQTDTVEIVNPNVLLNLNCDPLANPLILIPVTIIGIDVNHSAALLVDNRRRHVEYFDPNGSDYTERWTEIQETLFENVKTRLPQHEIVSLDQFCPNGPQGISGDAFCAAWTLLYLRLRIQFPTLSRVMIVRTLTHLSKLELKLVISGFLCYLKLYGSQHQIFLALNIYETVLDIFERFNESSNVDVQDQFHAEFIRIVNELQELINSGRFELVKNVYWKNLNLLNQINLKI